jgi:putative SOS response-associated peptidase YedK
MSGIHDRMPLILDRSAEAAWLDPEIRNREILEKILQPSSSSRLDAVEISSLVNSTKNNSAEILKPHLFVDSNPRLF